MLLGAAVFLAGWLTATFTILASDPYDKSPWPLSAGLVLGGLALVATGAALARVGSPPSGARSPRGGW